VENQSQPPVYLYEKLQKKVPLFAIILTLLIAEEVFARWLFLGVLGQVFTGPVAIFVLFFDWQ
jgi:membrane protease YdiL (CAAX protease family)